MIVNRRLVRLEDCCFISKGKKATASENGRYLVYGAGANEIKRSDSSNAEAGSIRLTIKGTVGEVYYHTEDFWAEDSCLILVPKEGLRSMYLYHWLKANQAHIKSLDNGLMMPSLNVERFKTLSFELPDIDYQDFVCQILEKMSLDIHYLQTQSDMVEKRSQFFNNRLMDFSEGG